MRFSAGGVPNTRLGTNLLVCPMPHERGGRLHFDRSRRRWEVSAGYESHPAYWVTWVGAAVMAAWSGARLPTRAEALVAAAGERAYNCDYAVGDSSPVTEPGRREWDVHHLVGNVHRRRPRARVMRHGAGGPVQDTPAHLMPQDTSAQGPPLYLKARIPVNIPVPRNARCDGELRRYKLLCSRTPVWAVRRQRADSAPVVLLCGHHIHQGLADLVRDTGRGPYVVAPLDPQ